MFDVRNRRSFLIKFAKKQGFDPLVAENWYSVPGKILKASKVIHLVHNHAYLQQGMSIITRIHGGYRKALIHLFPELKLDPKKFHYDRMNHLYYRVH